jgi:phospholipid transport system substrate-binding protein
MPSRSRLLTLALAATVVLAPALAEAGDAAGAFKTSHESIVKLVGRDASDAELRKVIDGMLDYGWLAEASLGGPDNYAKVCADRCAEFEALLTELVRENYIRMVRKADEHPVEYIGQVEGKGGVHKVTTKMKVDRNGRERNVTVEYVMHQSGGAWQVRDIITDEVSLAKTYRHEFNKLAKAEGIDGIIERLEDKLAKIDAGDAG